MLEFWLIDTNGNYGYNAGDGLVIAEPVKFDDCKMYLKRDADYFGVQYEYSDGEVDLIFGGLKRNKDTGFDLLETAWNADGFDAVLEMRIVDTRTGIIEFRSDLKFKDRMYDGTANTITMKLVRTSFEDKLRTRIDVPVDIKGTTGYDGQSSSAISSDTLHVRPPVTQRFLRAEINNPRTLTSPNYGDNDRIGCFLFSFDQVKSGIQWFNYGGESQDDEGVVIKMSTIGDMSNLDTEDIDGDYKRYLEYRYYAFKNDKRGEVWQGNLTWDFDADLTWTGGTSQTNVEIMVKCIVMNGGVPIREETLLDIDDGTVSNPETKSRNNVYLVTDLTLKYGDEVYLCVLMKSTGLGARTYEITYNSGFIKYEPLVYKEGESVTVYEPENVVNKIIDAITGQSSAHTGSFFSTGMAKNNRLTNGNLLKGADSDQVNISLEDVLKGMKSLFWAGYAIEEENGVDKVRIAHAADFFQDKEIMNIEKVYDYSEDVADNDVFNEIEIGFANVAKDSEFSAIDAHANLELVNEVSTIKRKYTQRCPFRMSAPHLSKAILERDEGRGDDIEFDDDQDIYMFSVEPISTITPSSVIGNASLDYLIFSGAWDIFKSLSSFSISSGTYSGSYTVLEAQVARGSGEFLYTVVKVSQNITSVLPQANPVVTFTELNQTEQDENVTSLTSGYETFPNLRHVAKNMLLNHSPYLGMSLFRKSGSSVRVTLNEKIQDYSYTFNVNEDYSTIGGTSVNHKADVSQADFTANNLFEPVWIKFKKKMTREQVEYIRDALKNASTDDVNYGYISVTHPRTGNKIKGFPFMIGRNTVTNETEFKLLKKA